MPPGKLECFPEFSTTWKVRENEIGPGKSWKLNLKVPKRSGICVWFELSCLHSSQFASASFSALYVDVQSIGAELLIERFLFNLAVPRWILLQCRIRSVRNCCSSLSLNIAGLLQSPGKCSRGQEGNGQPEFN